MKHWMIACLAVIGLPACSSDGDVNLGEHNPIALGSKLEDYSAVWQGYAEAHDFTFGSDRMLLRIDESGEGYAVFGEGTAPPPATNPDVGYPEGMDYMQFVTTLGEFRGGVQYPLHDVVVEDRRIRFWVTVNDLWQDWCRLQEPVLSDANSGDEPAYDLYPYTSWRQDGSQCYVNDNLGQPFVQADCTKVVLHQERVCSCTATGCEPNPHTSRVEFDAALESEGEELVGTLTVAGRVTVRLTRE